MVFPQKLYNLALELCHVCVHRAMKAWRSRLHVSALSAEARGRPARSKGGSEGPVHHVHPLKNWMVNITHDGSMYVWYINANIKRVY